MNKKLLTILLVFALVILPFGLSYKTAHASPALVQFQAVYPGTSVAFDSNNTAGNMIVVSIQDYSAIPVPLTEATVSDSQGNTYVLATTTSATTAPELGGFYTLQWIYYAKNIAAGANTVTVTPCTDGVGACTDTGFDMAEFSGLDTASPYSGQAANGQGNGTVLSTYNLTAAQDALLVVSFGNESHGDTFTPDNGYTLITQNTGHISSLSYKTVSSGSYNASGTYANGGNWSGTLVAFYTPSSPPPSNTKPTLMVQGTLYLKGSLIIR